MTPAELQNLSDEELARLIMSRLVVWIVRGADSDLLSRAADEAKRRRWTKDQVGALILKLDDVALRDAARMLDMASPPPRTVQ